MFTLFFYFHSWTQITGSGSQEYRKIDFSSSRVNPTEKDQVKHVFMQKSGRDIPCPSMKRIANPLREQDCRVASGGENIVKFLPE